MYLLVQIVANQYYHIRLVLLVDTITKNKQLKLKKKKIKKKDEKTLAECRKEEATYYEQAYEGFLKAIASENFPMCGMEESTVNPLMANIAYKLGKVDIASRFISMILTSQAASRVAKDRAMLLKEEIIAKLHGKG